MKNSGIEWIGEIPIDWCVVLLKRYIIQNDGGVWGNDPQNDKNDIVVLRSTEQTVDGEWNINKPALRDLSLINNIEYYKCKSGDLLITKSSGSDMHIGKTTIVTDEIESMECCYSNFIQRIKVCDGFMPKFLWYLFNSNIVREQFVYMQNSTSGIGNLNAKYISNLRIPFQKCEIQRRIVDYLDEKCAKIDSIIEKQRQIIEKLKEYKLSMITEAVTKGLNPNVEMKDSGIDWIGDIPSKWQIIKIKYLGEYKNGLTYSPSDVVDENEGILVLRSSNIKDGKLCFDDNVFVSSDYVSSLIKKDDILICSRNGSKRLIGKNALIDTDIEACFGAFMMIYRCVSPRYIKYVLDSSIFEYYLGSFFTSTINQLTGGNFGNMRIPYCPNSIEREQIVEYLDKKCSFLDKTIQEREKTIEKLKDYKKSLIFEIVTGKKEI